MEGHSQAPTSSGPVVEIPFMETCSFTAAPSSADNSYSNGFLSYNARAVKKEKKVKDVAVVLPPTKGTLSFDDDEGNDAKMANLQVIRFTTRCLFMTQTSFLLGITLVSASLSLEAIHTHDGSENYQLYILYVFYLCVNRMLRGVQGKETQPQQEDC